MPQNFAAILVGNISSFSPQGNILASSEDGSVKLWNVSTGEYLKSIQENASLCGQSPSVLKTVNSWQGEDGTVRLWDVSTGECLKSIQEHTGDGVNQSPSALKVRLWSLAVMTPEAMGYQYR